MTGLATGARDVARGFAFLKQHPRLWKYVVAPALVTLLLLVAIVAAALHAADSLVTWLAGHLPSFLVDIGTWLLWLVVLAALVVGALLVFVSVAGMVAGPFNELLSERVEQELTGTPAPRFSLAAFARGAAVGIAHSLRRLAVALITAGLVFALGFIPVVGTIAALVIGFWLAARSTAYDCYDAVLARRELPYRDKLAYLRSHRSRTLGLGATVAAMLLVPGLNLLALGIGAIGATLAAHD